MGKIYLVFFSFILISCSGKHGGITHYGQGADGGRPTSRTNTNTRTGDRDSTDPADSDLADLGPQDRKPSIVTNYRSTKNRDARNSRDRFAKPPQKTGSADAITFVSRRSPPRRRVWISVRLRIEDNKIRVYSRPGFWQNTDLVKLGMEDPVWLLEEAVIRQRNDYSKRDEESKWVKLSFGTNQGWTQQENISSVPIPLQARRNLDLFADTVLSGLQQGKGLRQYLSPAGIVFSMKYAYQKSDGRDQVWCKDIRLTRDTYSQAGKVKRHEAVNGVTHYDFNAERVVAHLDFSYMKVFLIDYRQNKVIYVNAREELKLGVGFFEGKQVVTTIDVFGFDR